MHKLFDFNGDGEVSSREQAFGLAPFWQRFPRLKPR